MNTSDLYLANLLGFSGGEKGPPVNKVVTGVNPAANTECKDQVPVGKLWRLISWAVTLAQGATQTPLPNLLITDANDVEVVGFPLVSAVINAATTTRLTAVPGVTLTAGAALTRNYAPIPAGLLIPAGFKLATVTTGIGANTDYGSPAIFVAEYSV